VALVAGRKRVPIPAAGKIIFLSDDGMLTSP